MAYELILSGRVQGVGCRYYCAHVGKTLNIHGNATNLPGGDVRVIAVTDSRQLAENFAAALRDNMFGIRFAGRIISVSVSEVSSIPHGDYEW